MSIRIRRIFEDDQAQQQPSWAPSQDPQPSQGPQINYEEVKKKIHDSLVDLIVQYLPNIITSNIPDYQKNSAYKQSSVNWNAFKASKDRSGDESIDAFKNYINSVIEGMNADAKAKSEKQQPSQAPSQGTQPSQATQPSQSTQPSQTPSQTPSQQPSQAPSQQTLESFNYNFAKSDFRKILKENLEKKLKQNFLNENY